ncbi:alpha/beta fold hydrolase [Salinibacterium sp. ZJ70]|uniref:alpha/beta fold hydrolase n=2 Tax=unclassified Salinibacterium TaxID=2632331 RepID=UPI00141F816A|nr:alpha/beta hydrolase [Salinibacterium sp. ZJ70]
MTESAGLRGRGSGDSDGGLLDRLLHRRQPALNVAIDEGEGPVVVLLHGIASSHVTFEFVVPLLRADHRVIALDLLGFGGSSAPEGATFTLDEHALWVRRTVRRLGLTEPIVLVGHSMGALVASRFAARYAHRVSRLVLVSPPIYLPPDVVGDPVDRAAMRFYREAYDYLRANPRFTMRAASVVGRLSPIKDNLLINEGNWTPFVLSLQNSIESQSAITDIATADVETRVVYGTLDPFVVPGAIRLIERLRHVTVQRVPGNDHVVRPRMARAVAAAVDGRPPGSSAVQGGSGAE